MFVFRKLPNPYRGPPGELRPQVYFGPHCGEFLKTTLVECILTADEILCIYCNCIVKEYPDITSQLNVVFNLQTRCLTQVVFGFKDRHISSSSSSSINHNKLC